MQCGCRDCPELSCERELAGRENRGSPRVLSAVRIRQRLARVPHAVEARDRRPHYRRTFERELSIHRDGLLNHLSENYPWQSRPCSSLTSRQAEIRTIVLQCHHNRGGYPETRAE